MNKKRKKSTRRLGVDVNDICGVMTADAIKKSTGSGGIFYAVIQPGSPSHRRLLKSCR